MPAPRERVPVLLDDLDAVLRGDFEAVERDPLPLLLAAPVEREELLLRAPEDRVDPVPDDLARLVFAFAPPELERDVLLLAGFFVAVEDLRPPLEEPDAPRDELDEEREPLLPSASIDHLPVITRCAASATASAMMVPSLVALETTLVAACDALSAASRPASRILRRADGLALIAAAAAARPAASISLLIAALASLSTVESFDREDDELDDEPDDRLEDDVEEFLRGDLAMSSLPRCRERHIKAVTVP